MELKLARVGWMTMFDVDAGLTAPFLNNQFAIINQQMQIEIKKLAARLY